MTSVTSGIGQAVLPDVYVLPIQIVNVCFVGDPQKEQDWVLVDAGMPESADDIIAEVKKRFGQDRAPKAIILTHGHFDHVGAVIDLVRHWHVPVYAHAKEIPYLTGESRYPQPDASVEGGMIAKMSALFPNEPVDLGHHVKTLPKNGNIPGMAGWRWIHTPGHSPGHVSLFREEDRTLIAGDAFITVRQDALLKVFTQKQEISGPPRYLTTDWQAAWDSVNQLEALKPELAVTGHGLPMSGTELSINLHKLSESFESLAIPDHGRYVNQYKH